MALFEISERRLHRRDPLTFAALGFRERQDLQALLLGQIEVLGEDLKVIAQEYGNWEDARRRLDILALDRDGHLVVIELKRTNDAGHAELQALRYAAMIATLTFDEVLAAYSVTLNTAAGTVLGEPGTNAREDLLAFLAAAADEEPTLSSDVRLILVAADFGRELTTTVLWLNQFDGMDVRCIRLRPYDLAGRTLLNVEQIIPLPEAVDYHVRMRRKEVERDRVTSDRRDFTRYVVLIDDDDVGEYNKRNAVRVMIESLIHKGISPADVAGVLPEWALRRLE